MGTHLRSDCEGTTAPLSLGTVFVPTESTVFVWSGNALASIEDHDVKEVTRSTEERVVDLFQSGEDVTRAIASDPRLRGIRVALLALQAGQGDPFNQWVVSGITLLIEHLRETLGHEPSREGDGRPLVVVVWSPPPTSPWEEAAIEACWQAARGVVQALTLERGAVDVRLNVVHAPNVTQADLRETLAFLACCFRRRIVT